MAVPTSEAMHTKHLALFKSSTKSFVLIKLGKLVMVAQGYVPRDTCQSLKVYRCRYKRLAPWFQRSRRYLQQGLWV